MKKYAMLFIFILPLCLQAQFTSEKNESSDSIIERDCAGKIFTLTEHLPSLNISKQAFEDSLQLYLTTYNALSSNTIIKVKFIITGSGVITGIEHANGAASRVLVKALNHFAHVWRPATQNDHAVCSRVNLTAIYQHDKLTMRLSQ